MENVLSDKKTGTRFIQKEFWQRTYNAVKGCQNADGGLGYSRGDTSYGSMTASMLTCLYISARSIGYQDAQIKDRDEWKKGVKWLVDNWSVDSGHCKSGSVGSGIGSVFYWLYSVERLFMMTSMEKLGAVDWYGDGVSLIIQNQQVDGKWNGKFFQGSLVDVPDTCFALLFLRRAVIKIVETGR